MLTKIKILYNNIECCLKYKACLEDYFGNEVGVLQGGTFSPLLFSLYVSDFEASFISGNCPSIDLQVLNLFLFMYADDVR